MTARRSEIARTRSLGTEWLFANQTPIYRPYMCSITSSNPSCPDQRLSRTTRPLRPLIAQTIFTRPTQYRNRPTIYIRLPPLSQTVIQGLPSSTPIPLIRRATCTRRSWSRWLQLRFVHWDCGFSRRCRLFPRRKFRWPRSCCDPGLYRLKALTLCSCGITEGGLSIIQLGCVAVTILYTLQPHSQGQLKER